MKKIKFVFGLLMISTFVAVSVLSYTTSTSYEDQAIRTSTIILSRNG